MNEKVVMVSNDYDRIDGRNAYQSDIHIYHPFSL